MDCVGSVAIRDIERQPIQPHVTSKMVQGWLQHCAQQHSHSSAERDAWLRLQDTVASGLLRAIDTFTGQVTKLGYGTRYVALSYVWGSVTLLNRLHILRAKGVVNYPRTVQDAMQFARDLGY